MEKGEISGKKNVNGGVTPICSGIKIIYKTRFLARAFARTLLILVNF